jgi:hypothetical protein
MSGWGGGFNRSSNVAASERSALLVRAQVGEPRNSRGYVRRRSPFVFPIPNTGFAGIAGFAGLYGETREPSSRGLCSRGEASPWLSRWNIGLALALRS